MSVDGGKTWMEASRYQKKGTPYIADNDVSHDKWAWVLFEAQADISDSTEIIAKAVQSCSINRYEFLVSCSWDMFLYKS